MWEPNGTGSGPGEEVSVIASCSAGNIEGSVNIVLNEREQPLSGGSYLSASINSDLNNRYTVVGCLAGTAVETDVGGCVCHCVSFLVRLFFFVSQAVANTVAKWHVWVCPRVFAGMAQLVEPRPTMASSSAFYAGFYRKKQATRWCFWWLNCLIFKRLERKTRLELATPTLARSCSTN